MSAFLQLTSITGDPVYLRPEWVGSLRRDRVWVSEDRRSVGPIYQADGDEVTFIGVTILGKEWIISETPEQVRAMIDGAPILRANAPARGCIWPPTSDQTCQSVHCPRSEWA